MNYLSNILAHPAQHYVLFSIFVIAAILVYAFIGQTYVYFALVHEYKFDGTVKEFLCCFIPTGEPKFFVGALWPIFLVSAIIVFICIILLCVAFAIQWIFEQMWSFSKWAHKLIFCGGLFKLVTGKTLTPSDK